MNKKELKNIIKYKKIISKETLSGFINHIQKDIRMMEKELKRKNIALKKLKS